MKQTLYLMLLGALLLAGCTHEGLETDRRQTVDLSDIGHEMIVLGETLSDPYSLDNMELAVRSLYPEKASRMDLRPTDLYVRFLPKTEAQLDTLLARGLVLVDHPLDRRIVREGDYYQDPEVGEDAITWQYAVVPPGYAFPKGIELEILDECYIAEHDAATRSSDLDWDAIEREAYRLSGNGDLLRTGTRAGGASQTPSGRITLLDEDGPEGEPVGDTPIGEDHAMARDDLARLGVVAQRIAHVAGRARMPDGARHIAIGGYLAARNPPYRVEYLVGELAHVISCLYV